MHGLASKLPVRALLDASEAERAVVAALRERGLLHDLETRCRDEGRDEGRLAALRASVRDLCEALDIEVDQSRGARVDALDAAALEELIARLKREHRWPE